MIVGRADVEAAFERIVGRIRRTPVIEVEMDGFRLVLKLELFQLSGSFKTRGAFNRVLAASSISPAGLVAASGGNHGIAVAEVARRLRLIAEIFVPEVTVEAKRDRIAATGARLVVGGAFYADAVEASRRRLAETGALEVPAYDHPLVVAGQGTMTLEIEEQVPSCDTMLVAVGGGGLIAGAAAVLDQRTELVGVEPFGAATLHAALEAGEPVTISVGGIASDSLGAAEVGRIPFATLAGRVDRVILVADEEIAAAQLWLWANLRLVAEPGGSTALAAVLSGRYRPRPGERIVVVVCGANTDVLPVSS